MQRILEAKAHKDYGYIVKVIEVRTSYKLHDNDSETMPLMSWVVVVHDVNDQIKEVHHYDKPIKAQRKFERLTRCQHKRNSPAHDPDMRHCLDCDQLVPATQL